MPVFLCCIVIPLVLKGITQELVSSAVYLYIASSLYKPRQCHSKPLIGYASQILGHCIAVGQYNSDGAWQGRNYF